MEVRESDRAAESTHACDIRSLRRILEVDSRNGNSENGKGEMGEENGMGGEKVENGTNGVIQILNGEMNLVI